MSDEPSVDPDLLEEILSGRMAAADPAVHETAQLGRRVGRIRTPGPSAASAQRLEARFERLVEGGARRGRLGWFGLGQANPGLVQRLAAGAVLLGVLGGSTWVTAGVSPLEVVARGGELVQSLVANLDPRNNGAAPLVGTETPGPSATPTLPPGAPSAVPGSPSPSASSTPTVPGSGVGPTAPVPAGAPSVAPFASPTPPPQAGTTTPTPTSTPPTSPGGSPTRTGGGTTTPTPSVTATPTSPVAPASPTPTSTASTPTPTPTQPSATATPTSTAPGGDVTVYPAGSAGSVSVRFDGVTLTVVSVQVEPGWTYVVERASGDQVKVKFDTAGSEVEFQAEVSDGEVQVSVDEHASQVAAPGGAS